MFKLMSLSLCTLALFACHRDDSFTPADVDAGVPTRLTAWQCANNKNLNADSSASNLAFINSALPTMPRWMQETLQTSTDPDIKIRTLKIKPSADVNQIVFGYERQGIPYCRIFGRIDEIKGQRFVQDRQEKIAALAPSLREWEDQKLSTQSAVSEIGINGQIESSTESKCWWDEAGALQPAWRIVAETNEGSIAAFANGKTVFEVAKRGFDLEASAQIHDKNIDGALVDVPLHAMEDTGVLSNAHFLMYTPPGAIAPLADDGVFKAEPTDSRFDEISIFANAVIMDEWFAQFPAKKTLDCNLVLLVPSLPSNINNASYSPASSNQLARISIGQGDGKLLQNLQTDADAVSHELGHHMAIRALTEMTDYKSVVIHEGLADFFVFAHTGDSCLGETLCPAESPACVVKGQCLRTGENNLKLTDDKLSLDAHLRSQVLSGMLWDIGTKIGLDKTAKIVFTGIDYLQPRSDYFDLVKALMSADLELYDGEHSCMIFDEAVARGLKEDLSELNCSYFVKHDEPNQ